MAADGTDEKDASMCTRTPVSILFLTLFLACASKASESSTGSGEPAANGASGGGPDAAGGGATVDAIDIVVNEVAAVGASEWIEIGNRGGAVIDVGGYSIAGSDKKTNAPKRSQAMKFPEGTKMAAGDHIVILTSKKGALVGPHPKAECLPDGPETCFFATFGVSATAGEAIHLLAPDGSIVSSTSVPKSAGADAGGSTTESKCRLPDFTGELTSCALTPGQPNRAP
ncbi:MAG: hypothetical protein JWP87_5419 [Labilithrix sp.]|nr:hypothetical protein [Labilithrix sp.]